LTLPITDPVLIVAIAMGIFLLAPVVVERFRLPGIVGLILAGAIVGPNAANLLDRSSTIVLLGTVGLLYLLFMAGIEIDLNEFRRYRSRSLVFGTISFLLPQTVGIGVMLALGYSWPAAILIASMFGSHTLLAYPIAQRFGIAKSPPVTTAVGGTIITDTTALLVLAVVAASTRGALDTAFWVRLIISLAVYVILVTLVLQRVARWFFRQEKTSASTQFLFVLFALFTGAYLAVLAGVEAIVGAFLVGLSLNRLIPDQSLLSQRLHFFGSTFFIPFFLLSVGMLVDVRVLLGSPRAWAVMAAMTTTVIVTKWTAAKITQKLYGYSAEAGWTMFGLSVTQAAATLAAALVGVRVGLLDDAVFNGVILMILITVVVGPLAVERYGRVLALREAEQPRPSQAPQRIMVPMAKPASAIPLMDLALAIREPDSTDPILPLTVVPDDGQRAAEYVAVAEKMLSHAVAHATAVGVPVVPLTRVDHNFANGITRGMSETRTSVVVIGWDGRRFATGGIFGSVLDQLLERTREQLLVAKLGHPLNTTQRLVLLIPYGSDHVPGFFDGVRALKLMANRLGASIHAYSVNASAEVYRDVLRRVRPAADVTVERASSWGALLLQLPNVLRPDDLVVVMSARRGAVSWTSALERLPGHLAELVPESFVMLYLSEVAPERGIGAAPPAVALAPTRVHVQTPPQSFERVMRTMLSPVFGNDPLLLERVVRGLSLTVAESTPRIRPGIVVSHYRLPDLSRSTLFLAASPRGIELPRNEEPAHLVFLLLTPESDPGEHLRQLAAIARLVSDDDRVRSLIAAETEEEASELLGIDSRAQEILV
jgi:Kef-type K+ transport system membrane component KefB